MEKSCKRCYWEETTYCEQCSMFSEFGALCDSCDEELADYRFEGEFYCPECMMKELGIKKIEVSFYEYHVDGDYVGKDSDYVDSEVIRIVNKDVECLGVW